MLASVGATAPFVGLLGTVIGIYHALIAIGVAGQASIDKVAGPVGEALIMTAIGLAVAVPAVLGYNILLRRNKGVQERVSHFTHELHAYLISGAKMGLGMDKGPRPRSSSPPRSRPARNADPWRSMSAADDEAEAMSDINVTPLVDVMLVLLIIFIITIRVIIQQVPVVLPKATNLPTQTKPENITIAIDKEGGIYWNTQTAERPDDLKARLRAIAREEPQPEVHIRGDSNVRYQFVGQVLVATQQIGIRKVAFITTPDHFGPGT